MIISIESSSSSLSLALLNRDKIINEFSISIKNDLSEIIVPTIKEKIKLPDDKSKELSKKFNIDTNNESNTIVSVPKRVI